MKKLCVLLVFLGVMGHTVVGNTETAVQAKVREMCTLRGWDPMTPDTSLEKLQALGEPGLQALEILAKLNDSTGVNALRYLRQLEDPRALPIARQVLVDPAANERRVCGALLVVDSFADSASLDRVLELFRTGSADVRERAAAALGSIGDARGLTALRAALTDPAYDDLGSTVVEAVGVLGHEAAVDPLLALGREEDPSGILDKVIASLADIGTPRSRGAAMDLLNRMPVDDTRGRLVEHVFRSFITQRRLSKDAAERAEIKAYLDTLRSDPSAPGSVKTHPDDPAQ
jgi:hypothetical protein